jgi:hypothetical protein
MESVFTTAAASVLTSVSLAFGSHPSSRSPDFFGISGWFKVKPGFVVDYRINLDLRLVIGFNWFSSGFEVVFIINYKLLGFQVGFIMDLNFFGI